MQNIKYGEYKHLREEILAGRSLADLADFVKIHQIKFPLKLRIFSILQI